MKHLSLVLFTIAPFAAVTPALADNPNWSDAQAEHVDAARNSDAGIGNGGERHPTGEWVDTIYGEDGPQDVDPGRSGDRNRACTGGSYVATDC
ncbi:hypothetical protein HKCCE3408_12425 [Rhodobacterales bacterium HKCCE3408]|nr:hypothetical protein [Rhodobacterales bacterium HKCCE3408]